MKHLYKHFRYLSVLIFLFAIQLSFSQTVKQEKMKQLSFMVGEWIGVSKGYKDGRVVRQVSAFQKIKYDLNKNIIVIDLRSESLQLHTIIYYDEKDEKYYYNPFSERSARKLPAEYKDGKFVVQSGDNNRFIFTKTEGNGFIEYGEKRENGKWIRYFEDTFKTLSK